MSQELVALDEGVLLHKEKKKCCGKGSKTESFGKSAKDVFGKGAGKVTSTWTEFKTFISKGNVFQLAIGFIIALQFNAVVMSLTNDIIMPPIGMAIGNNLVNLFLVIKPGNSFYNQSNIVNGVAQPANPPPPPYTTLKQAQDDKAVTWNWGLFFQTCINFIIVALILFLIVTIYSKMVALKKIIMKEKDPFTPTMVDCPMCYSSIDNRSKRCKFCSSEVDFEKKKD